MKTQSNSRSSGMALVEILVALAAMSFISLVGLRAVHGFMEGLVEGRLEQRRVLEITELRASFGHAWDQRVAHPFQERPWLSIEGESAGDFIDLDTLRMRTYSPKGNIVHWEIRRIGDQWLITPFLDEETGAGIPRSLQYTGRIFIEAEDRASLPGEVPDSIAWRFPDARNAYVKEGFAILRDW